MRTYLYLLRRNKQGFKLLTVLLSQEVKPTKIENIDSLNLPAAVATEIKEIIKSHIMDWELWIESCNDFLELRNHLEKQGYSNLPSSASPLHNSASYNDPYIVQTKNIKKRKTMLRKK